MPYLAHTTINNIMPNLTLTRPQFRKQILELWGKIAHQTACYWQVHSLYWELYGGNTYDGYFPKSKDGKECTKAFNQFMELTKKQ